MESRPGATAAEIRQRHALIMVVSERECASRHRILATAEIVFREFWFHSFLPRFPLRCRSRPRRIQKSCSGHSPLVQCACHRLRLSCNKHRCRDLCFQLHQCCLHNRVACGILPSRFRDDGSESALSRAPILILIYISRDDGQRPPLQASYRLSFRIA